MSENNHQQQVGIIIVSHADFGAALLKTTESILGPLSDCSSISLGLSSDVEDTVRRLNDAADRLDKGDGVLILTDMFGGTPTNLALALLGRHRVEVVTGVNLPMTLKIFEQRNLPLKDLAMCARDAGLSGIVIAGEMLRSRAKERPSS